MITGPLNHVDGNRTLLAYVDDIVIHGESQDQIISTTLKLIQSSQRIGLKISEDKTKYMLMARRFINIQNLNIGQFSFVLMDNYKNLGVNINANNSMHNEISLIIAVENRGYFAMNRVFKSRLISKELKIKLYTTYLCPVIMYGSETWSTTKGD